MIYFIQAENGGPIKIGFSLTEEGCKRRLQTGNPHVLVIRKMIEGDLFGEQDLHRQFQSSRLAGEWFFPTPEICAMGDCLEGSAPDVGFLQALRRQCWEEGYEAAEDHAFHEGVKHATNRIVAEIDATIHPHDREQRSMMGDRVVSPY